MWLTQVGPTPGVPHCRTPITDAREGAASCHTGLSAALLAESAMQKRPSLLGGFAVRALRPTGHTQTSALGRRRDAGTTIVGALPLSQAHSPLVAYDSFGLPARECSRPAPSRPRVRTASLSIAQFLLSYAFHHFVGERLGLLRGLGGGDEGQEVFDDVAHP